MRRLAIWTLGVTVAVLFAGVCVFSDVRNSPHNLSSTAGTGQITDKSTDEDQICVFCHTPHDSSPSVPLWNHTLSGAGSYTVYSSTTLDAVVTDFAGGTAVSNMCMSCHDGTVGVNDLGNPANDTGGNPTMGSGNELDATTFAILAGRSTNLGSDLSNDHPVNFTYDGTLASTDGELVTPNSTDWVDVAQTVPLFGGTVQCASCHDPHDNTNQPFLVKANTGSGLCLTCHQK